MGCTAQSSPRPPLVGTGCKLLGNGLTVVLLSPVQLSCNVSCSYFGVVLEDTDCVAVYIILIAVSIRLLPCQVVAAAVLWFASLLFHARVAVVHVSSLVLFVYYFVILFPSGSAGVVE